MILKFALITVSLVVLELLYFWIARRFNIVDNPNSRSSHTTAVLRGGGIVFLMGVWLWSAFFGFEYPWFLAAVTLAAGISFADDIRSLPDSIRLVVQFAAMGLMLLELYLYARYTTGLMSDSNLLVTSVLTISALVICVGASNIFNFMDGINGITASYTMAALIPLYILNEKSAFADGSLIISVALADLVFAYFNFRPKGKAKCFAGDVGALSVAFILVFLIGRVIILKEDVTYLVFLLVYGIDGCLTICHRIMLHEKIGTAHRKHMYQLMANELKMSHVTVSVIYGLLQLAISLGFILLCPDTVAAHWIYLASAALILSVIYCLFMKKNYHLHQRYLDSLKDENRQTAS